LQQLGRLQRESFRIEDAVKRGTRYIEFKITAKKIKKHFELAIFINSSNYYFTILQFSVTLL